MAIKSVFLAAHLQSVLVLFFRRQTAPDMAFGFVDVQYHSGLSRQRRVDVLQTFRHVLMYGCNKMDLKQTNPGATTSHLGGSRFLCYKRKLSISEN